jgi:Tfp pilus assembly protein PilP
MAVLGAPEAPQADTVNQPRGFAAGSPGGAPWLVLTCLATISLGASSYAQGGGAAPAPSPAGQTAEAPARPSALEPSGYTYNPEGRRDPFVSLVRRGAESPGTAPTVRPAGLAGLTASEVSLRGTLKGRDGFVAMLQGADNRTYLVRAGDRLLDGTIRTITADEVVILQRVSDPLSVETEREVRKVLRQTEEAK